MITQDPVRLITSASLLLLYLLLCIIIFMRHQRRKEFLENNKHIQTEASSILVVYASQTGHAETLAHQTWATLQNTGQNARLMDIGQLDTAQLKKTRLTFFIVSTYGTGDAPDHAASFVQQTMTTQAQFTRLHFAILALGDRHYPYFCRFGHLLYHWLDQCSATAIQPVIEMDGNDPQAIRRWHHLLQCETNTVYPLDQNNALFQPWRLVKRIHLNPGSSGEPVFHLELTPDSTSIVTAQPLDWQAGDLAYIQPPASSERARAYSISSLPHHGSLQLLVRLHRHTDGTPGLTSGWLTQTLRLGETVPLQLHSHPSFHLGENAHRPLILIGNGTGIAGLRALLMQREKLNETQNWLLFGERHAKHDFFYQKEIETWQKNGLLSRSDFAFSRNQNEKIYVQHRLEQAQKEIRLWLQKGAAIYLCGSAKGMASAVDTILTTIIGKQKRDQLILEGRYRRDIY